MKSSKQKRPKKKSARIKRPYDESAFVKSVWQTMQAQERKSPEIALLHRRLTKDSHQSGTKLIGLTGGIAAGKTLVATLLAKRKIPVIDADVIAREVVKPRRPAHRQIVNSFGEGILNEDKTIDRQRLGQVVFTHPEQRRLLEEITHPEILKEIVKRIKSYEKKRVPLVVIDAALLFETGLDRFMDKTILVTINPNVQQQRLMKRDNLSEFEAWQRILAQLSHAAKIQRADFVIDNSGDKKHTEAQLNEMIKKL